MCWRLIKSAWTGDRKWLVLDLRGSSITVQRQGEIYPAPEAPNVTFFRVAAPVVHRDYFVFA
ncbi:hypothetical protein C1Y31_32305, partial [Pseudomonas sp. FW305-25]